MRQQRSSVRTTYKYRLTPTLAQAQALTTLLARCRTLYNTAMEERKTAWERCHVSVNYYQQKAELPDPKLDFPEYAEVHSYVLQDVLLRLERTFQAFFRRLKAARSTALPQAPPGANVGRWAERSLRSPRLQPWGACHILCQSRLSSS